MLCTFSLPVTPGLLVPLEEAWARRAKEGRLTGGLSPPLPLMALVGRHSGPLLWAPVAESPDAPPEEELASAPAPPELKVRAAFPVTSTRREAEEPAARPSSIVGSANIASAGSAGRASSARPCSKKSMDA